MAKVITDKMSAKIASEDGGRWDAVAVNPCVVLGPCMTTAHELVGSWQWVLARMLAGKPCLRGHQALWNICDVRDWCGKRSLFFGGGKKRSFAKAGSGQIGWKMNKNGQPFVIIAAARSRR
jgi:hypothetical protein